MYISKMDKFIEISNDGLTVTFEQSSFEFGKLPKKLQQWYHFAL